MEIIGRSQIKEMVAMEGKSLVGKTFGQLSIGRDELSAVQKEIWARAYEQEKIDICARKGYPDRAIRIAGAWVFSEEVSQEMVDKVAISMIQEIDEAVYEKKLRFRKS